MFGDTAVFAAAALAPPFLGVVTYVFLRRAQLAPSTWRRVVTGNLLLLLFLLSLVFLAAESHYRFWSDATIGDNRSKVSRRWFAQHWIRNQQGLRDNINYQFAQEAGKRRITFLGDSFTAGHGIADVDNRFINLTRSKNPDWEVHGIAQTGLSIIDHMAALEHIDEANYYLDIVVLVYCYNDIEPFVPQMQRVYEVADRPPPNYLDFLVEHSYAINTWFHHWRTRQAASAVDNTSYFVMMMQAYSGQPWLTQEAMLRRLKTAVESRGGKLVVVTFPLLLQQARETKEVEVMHLRLDTLWRDLGVAHLDLRDTFEPHDSDLLVVNRSDDHPSKFAHRLAADAMQPLLEKVVHATEP